MVLGVSWGLCFTGFLCGSGCFVRVSIFISGVCLFFFVGEFLFSILFICRSGFFFDGVIFIFPFLICVMRLWLHLVMYAEGGVCVFWKAVVGVFWLLCFDWFVLVKWLCKALWFFFFWLCYNLFSNESSMSGYRQENTA